GTSGEKDLAKKDDEAAGERSQSGDEYDADHVGYICVEERAQKQRDDDGANEKGADRAEADGVADQPGAPRENGNLAVQAFLDLRRRIREAPLQATRAIDDPAQPVRQHAEHGADAAQQEDRRHRELNDMRDRRNAGFHATSPFSDRRS